jgi:Tfp pilus assembly protein PilX
MHSAAMRNREKIFASGGNKEMKSIRMIGNEEGSVLVLALIMLVLLTLLGIAATRTSEIEIQIAGNERTYKLNFFSADGAVMECCQRVDNGGTEMTAMNGTQPNWMIDLNNKNVSGVTVPYTDDITNAANWTNDFSQKSSLGSDIRFMAFFDGTAAGSALDMTETIIYEYRGFGRSEQRNGVCVIGVGFRKAASGS